MNILVIGAAGRTGDLVVQQALAAGHHVTAFVRGENQSRPGVDVVTGNANDAAKMDEAMASQDAVIDTVGGKTPYKDTDLERSVAHVVLASMKKNGVKRLVAVSALGVGESKEQSGFFYEHLLLPTFLRGSTKDKAAMEQEIETSGIDYVIVRPAILKDGEARGSVRVFEGDAKAHKVDRADVAQFLLQQVKSTTYVGRAVTIAND